MSKALKQSSFTVSLPPYSHIQQLSRGSCVGGDPLYHKNPLHQQTFSSSRQTENQDPNIQQSSKKNIGRKAAQRGGAGPGKQTKKQKSNGALVTSHSKLRNKSPPQTSGAFTHRSSLPGGGVSMSEQKQAQLQNSAYRQLAFKKQQPLAQRDISRSAAKSSPPKKSSLTPGGIGTTFATYSNVKKRNVVEQQSPLGVIKPKHRSPPKVFSSLHSKERSRYLNIKNQSPPTPALNYQVYCYNSRDTSPNTEPIQQKSQKKFLRQQQQATNERLAVNQTQSVPPTSHAVVVLSGSQPTTRSGAGNKIKDSMARHMIGGAGTFEMQMKRQNTTASKAAVGQGSPAPKGQKKSQAVVSTTVSKKVSKSKITSSKIHHYVPQNSSSTKKTAPLSHSAIKAASGHHHQTPSIQSVNLLMQKRGSPSPHYHQHNALSKQPGLPIELHRVSEEARYPIEWDDEGQYVMAINNQALCSQQKMLLPQLNAVANFQFPLVQMQQSSPNISKKKRHMGSSSYPLAMEEAMAHQVDLKKSAESRLNDDTVIHISSPINAPQLGSPSAPSPFGVNSGLSHGAFEQFLQSSQRQNREILNSILKNLGQDAASSDLNSPAANHQVPYHVFQFTQEPQGIKRGESQTSNDDVPERRRSATREQSPQMSASPPTAPVRQTSTSNSGALSESIKRLSADQIKRQAELIMESHKNSSPNIIPAKKSGILKPSQQVLSQANLLMTPIISKQDVLCGGLDQNAQQQNFHDKENRMILSNSANSNGNITNQISNCQQPASNPFSVAGGGKVSLKYKNNQEGSSMTNNGGASMAIFSQKRTSKKQITNENNAPSMVGGKNGGLQTSSVSIFHQVMSETPLRLKNSGVPSQAQNNALLFSQIKEPLKEIVINSQKTNPQKKHVNNQASENIMIDDFMAKLSPFGGSTPQPIPEPPVRFEEAEMHQKLMEGILSASTNPFIQALQNVPNSGKQLYDTLSGRLRGAVEGASQMIQDPLTTENSMIEDQENRPPPRNHLMIEIHQLSERSEIKTHSSYNSSSSSSSIRTVVAQEHIQKSHNHTRIPASAKYGRQVDSSQRRQVSSSKAYYQSRIIEQNLQSNLDRSRDPVSSIYKMPTTFNAPFGEPLDLMETRGKAPIPPLNLNALVSKSIGAQNYSDPEQTSSACSSNEESSERKLNNTLIDEEDRQKLVEAKLHHIQFQKVFCTSNHHRDDLMAYFIKRHHLQMGLVPPEENSSCCSSTDGMSNFSLEIEMLNKLHVQKNNKAKLSQLPIMMNHLLPDPSLPLYLEEPTSNGLLFRKDERPRIYFQDPVTVVKNSRKTSEQILFEGSLTQKLKNIGGLRSGNQKSVAATGLGDDYVLNDNEMCLRMDNRYFESSDEKVYRACSAGHSSGQVCNRCQQDNAYIRRYGSQYSSSSAAAGGYDRGHGGSNSSNSFTERQRKCRRRIDHQFTSTPTANKNLNQIIDLQDIQVQPFCAWDENLQSSQEPPDAAGPACLQPAIMKQSLVKAPQKQLVPMFIPTGIINQENQAAHIAADPDADFQGIPELSNQSDHFSEQLFSHLYVKPQNPVINEKNHQILELKTDQQNLQESYDRAVQQYRWLHESMGGGGQDRNGVDDGWLMRPFNYTQQSEGQGEVRKLRENAYSPALKEKQISSKVGEEMIIKIDPNSSFWSSGAEEDIKKNDEAALQLFSNPQVKEHVQACRRLFEGCESIGQSQHDELSSITSSDRPQSAYTHNETPLTFDSVEEAQVFVDLLREQLHMVPGNIQDVRIQPMIKSHQVEYQLKAAVYSQIPFMQRDTPIEVELFNFDELLIQPSQIE